MDIFTESNTELEQAKLTATDYGAKIDHKLTPPTNLYGEIPGPEGAGFFRL